MLFSLSEYETPLYKNPLRFVRLEKKNSICFDSGMPSTTSNNSDSACSQAFSSSDLDVPMTHAFYDRTDSEQLVHARSTTTTKKILHPEIQQLFVTKFHSSADVAPYTSGGGDHHSHQPRISSEEESGFSTPTKSQHGKRLVYEVVV